VNKPLAQKTIDKVFEEASQAEVPSQADYILGLYGIAFPNWDQIAKVNGWPRVSKVTSEYIFQRAIAFDEVHHPECFAGGAWMNNGFTSTYSGDEPMPDWEIDISEVELEMKGNK